MKQYIQQLIIDAHGKAHEAGDLASPEIPKVEIEAPKFDNQGDFSCNIAMVSASAQKKAPRKIAEALVKHMVPSKEMLRKIEIAGPGFINFFTEPSAWHPVLKEIHEKGEQFGKSSLGQGKKVQVEFVSANPTGPLHVGHGRCAAVGDVLASVLSFCGYEVHREYYINDSGRQIKTLGRSVFLRYMEIFGIETEFPKDCYQGDYIRDLAREIQEIKGNDLLEFKEEDAVYECARFAAKQILRDIEKDLRGFGITYDRWFSEQVLYDEGKVDAAIADYEARNQLYLHDGAKWFRSSAYGDEKDRVVVRSNGETTYFASDIAYHQNKFERGFERIVDVWGADHHGYIPRMKATIEASGHSKDQLDVILINLVNLLRNGEPVAMSTRAGEFETLEDVVKEVGRDAARFIFLTRHHESPLDFDLEVAKKKTNDNPVYYVQYVHARIASILRNSLERDIKPDERKDESVSRLVEPEEIHLIKAMARYPEVLENSAIFMEPHRVSFYLMELSAAFHAYYNKHRVLTDDAILTQGRLNLVSAVKKVIGNGLSLMGVSSPEKM
ncbi:MAG: arginine--tRNA ligase [Proteobacteria bacterium]|nr:arginine--tRNA ligase [Pseudomonadota bacterium]